MMALSDMNCCLCCRESDSGWELVIPHALVPKLATTSKISMQYKPNKYLGTSHYRNVVLGICLETPAEKMDWVKYNESCTHICPSDRTIYDLLCIIKIQSVM